MPKKLLVISALFISILLTGCSGNSKSPQVIGSYPQNGTQDVDPNLNEIWVQFDKTMEDQSWSWAYRKEVDFPELAGAPYYTDNYTKNVLPVKLEADKEYVIWINTENLKNFKDKEGNASEPFEFKFKTRE